MNLHLSQSDGFLRVAAASPQIRVADVEGNAEVALAAFARWYCPSLI